MPLIVEAIPIPVPSVPITLYAQELTKNKKSSNKISPIKNGTAIVVKLGKTVTLKLKGRIYSIADYNYMDAWDGETVLKIASGTDYKGITVGTYWLITNMELKESKGRLTQWDWTLELAEATTVY
jgi:hypothetical protein